MIVLMHSWSFSCALDRSHALLIVLMRSGSFSCALDRSNAILIVLMQSWSGNYCGIGNCTHICTGLTCHCMASVVSLNCTHLPTLVRTRRILLIHWYTPFQKSQTETSLSYWDIALPLTLLGQLCHRWKTLRPSWIRWGLVAFLDN